MLKKNMNGIVNNKNTVLENYVIKKTCAEPASCGFSGKTPSFCVKEFYRNNLKKLHRNNAQLSSF